MLDDYLLNILMINGGLSHVRDIAKCTIVLSTYGKAISNVLISLYWKGFLNQGFAYSSFSFTLEQVNIACSAGQFAP